VSLVVYPWFRYPWFRYPWFRYPWFRFRQWVEDTLSSEIVSL